MKNITGMKFNKLTAIKCIGSKDRSALWLCRCDCGNEVTATLRALQYNQKKSCGCDRKSKIDLAGKRFGKLLVLYKSDKKWRWICKCDCGKLSEHYYYDLLNGYAKSCGCLKKERNLKHGQSQTRLYRIWSKMKQRCYNPNETCYERYGGRGVKVCDEWLNDFECFFDWAYSNGYTDKLTIDRIDVNGNYEPSNCRWADTYQQSRNKRSNRIYTYHGKTLCLADWAKEYGINYSSLCKSISRGHSFEETISRLVSLNQEEGA